MVSFNGTLSRSLQMQEVYVAGIPRTFYIHPQNDRKSDIRFLDECDRVAELANIPPVQFESVDLCGTEDDWRSLHRGTSSSSS